MNDKPKALSEKNLLMAVTIAAASAQFKNLTDQIEALTTRVQAMEESRHALMRRVNDVLFACFEELSQMESALRNVRVEARLESGRTDILSSRVDSLRGGEHGQHAIEYLGPAPKAEPKIPRMRKRRT